MAVFQFRLASVLRFRERVKEEKQWELQALLAEGRRLEEEIQRLEEEWARAGDAIGGRAAMIFSSIELRLYSDYAALVAQRIKERRRSLKNLQAKVDVKRQEVIESARDVKTLEQLRARLERNFRHEQNVLEQKTSDEIGQRKFARSQTRKKIPR